MKGMYLDRINHKDIEGLENYEITTDIMQDEEAVFPELEYESTDDKLKEFQYINVPEHRYRVVKDKWIEIYEPIAKHMKLNIRYNIKKKRIELLSTKFTTNSSAMQKSVNFCKAICLGFEIKDAVAILRLDDIYIDRYVGIYVYIYNIAICIILLFTQFLYKGYKNITR